MPAEQIGPLLASRFDLRRLIELKHQWGVSVAALLYRSRELGVMSESTYRRAVTFMSAKGYRVKEPAPITKPERPVLLHRCRRALDQLGWTLEDLAEEARVPVERISPFFNNNDPRTRVSILDH